MFSIFLMLSTMGRKLTKMVYRRQDYLNHRQRILDKAKNRQVLHDMEIVKTYEEIRKMFLKFGIRVSDEKIKCLLLRNCKKEILAWKIENGTLIPVESVVVIPSE